MSEIENKPKNDEQTTIGVSRETLANLRILARQTRRFRSEILKQFIDEMALISDTFVEGNCGYWFNARGDVIEIRFFGKKKMTRGTISDIPVDAEDPSFPCPSREESESDERKEN